MTDASAVVASATSTAEPGVAQEETQDLRDQAGRLWAHLLHLDAQFAERGNLYLVGESMLVVGYSAILAAGPGGLADKTTLTWVARVIGFFGILMAGIWWYSAATLLKYFTHVRQRAIVALPEYRETREQRPRTLIPGGVLTALAPPIVTAISWIFLILLV